MTDDLTNQLARMRRAAGNLSAHVEEGAAQTRHRHAAFDETETAAEDATSPEEKAFSNAMDMKNNGVFQIMSKTSLSSDEQINAIVKYLTVENEDYVSARRHFNEFQAYFNHVQSEGMKLDMRGLEKLIKEVKSALKPEVEKIVKDVIAVQEGVDESKHMLEVMRTARLEGKTIDQMKEAIDLNDRILKEIEKINAALKGMQETETFRKSTLEEKLDAKLASEKGFWNGLARSVFGADKKIAKAIDDAQARLEATQESIKEIVKDLEAKQGERKTNLETGPMQILRSIDATDDGFAENIVTTANKSLALIQGASTSVQRLLKRMAYSKVQALEISDSIAKAEVREAILEGGVARSVKNSHDQSEGIKTRLGAQDEKVASTDDVVLKAGFNAERVGLAELQKTALAFEEDMKRAHAQFAMTEADTVEAQSRASSFYTLLLAQEDMLQQVAARTLPETARALRMGLEVNIGMQTTELASSIQAVTKRAIEIGKDSYKSLATTQGELRQADLKLMEDAIAALNAAQSSVVDAAEATVKHSADRGNLTGNLTRATDGLRDLLEQFDDIRARAADPLPTAGGTPPVETANVDFDAPAPAHPANDGGKPAATPKAANGPGG